MDEIINLCGIATILIYEHLHKLSEVMNSALGALLGPVEVAASQLCDTTSVRRSELESHVVALVSSTWPADNKRDKISL